MEPPRLRTAAWPLTSAPLPASHGRWLALDRLRALAVVAMIQGHVFTALLRPDSMPGAIHRWHDRLHGLTAPAFMFGAGLAFGTATYGQYARHRTLGKCVAKRMRWYTLLFVLGYVLQAPGGSLWAALHAHSEQLWIASRVGALQLVALALGVCQLAILLLPRVGLHIAFTLVLGATVLALGPTSHVGVRGATSFLSAFWEDRGGAHFQPCPWAAFVLFGAGSAGLLASRSMLRRGLVLTGAGAACALIAYQLFQHASALAGQGWQWRVSPSYFLYRLGCVALLLGLLHAWPARAQAQARPSRWSGLLAQHSLVAYVVHLLLLYGTSWAQGLEQRWARSLSLPQAMLVFCAVLLVTVGVTQLWARFKERQPRVPRALEGAPARTHLTQ